MQETVVQYVRFASTSQNGGRADRPVQPATPSSPPQKRSGHQQLLDLQVKKRVLQTAVLLLEDALEMSHVHLPEDLVHVPGGIEHPQASSFMLLDQSETIERLVAEWSKRKHQAANAAIRLLLARLHMVEMYRRLEVVQRLIHLRGQLLTINQRIADLVRDLGLFQDCRNASRLKRAG